MSNLLSLKKNMFLRIKNQKSDSSVYKCLSIKNIKILGYHSSSRYYLQAEENYQQIILEVKKDKKHNILISTYHFIEKSDFNIALLSTLGSETLIYNKKDQKNLKENYYQIIKTSTQNERYFKYMVEQKELPYIDNYAEDGFGNFYSILKKISPHRLISNQETDLFWKYKNNTNENLHIEVNQSKKSIIFYKEIKLKRENIHLINSKYSKDYNYYDDFKEMRISTYL